MFIVYEVYNKFNGFVHTETASEEHANSIQENLNDQCGNTNPFDYTWAITSRYMTESYKNILLKKNITEATNQNKEVERAERAEMYRLLMKYGLPDYHTR